MKSDVYPPKKHAGWDTVAVLEELEAEEVHFHKNNLQVGFENLFRIIKNKCNNLYYNFLQCYF